MNKLMKIIITIVAFFVLGFAITFLKQAKGLNTGYGGPVGLALVFVFLPLLEGFGDTKQIKFKL